MEFRELRRAYGFEEVAIVPGGITANPDQTNLDFKIGDITFEIPFIAAAMDGVTDVDTAILMSKYGGLGVINLDGVQTRYEDYKSVLQQIVNAPRGDVTTLLQKFYQSPVKPELAARRVSEVKAGGGKCAVSLTPQNTKKLAPAVVEAGADILVIQSTVTSARHISKSEKGLILHEICQQVPVPVLVGNCVSPIACLELMREGIAGVLIGVAPRSRTKEYDLLRFITLQETHDFIEPWIRCQCLHRFSLYHLSSILKQRLRTSSPSAGSKRPR